jgi:hypothetical protein
MRLEYNMDKAHVQQFRNRWLAVQEVQRKEECRTTFELRWQQLNAAFGMGKGLQLASSHSDEMQVYLRWAKLKENLPLPPKA